MNPQRHPALVNADDVLVLEEDARRNGASAPSRLRPLSSVIRQQVRWLVRGMIPLRTLTLVAGVGGLGKSTYLLGVAAATSRGDLLGEPADTIIVSFEDPAAEVLRPRLEAAQADLDRVHEIRFEAEAIDMLQLPRDLLLLREAVQEARAKLIVVDPIVAAIETSLDAHKDQAVRHVLGGLAQLSEDETCAVALVGHLNKAPRRMPTCGLRTAPPSGTPRARWCSSPRIPSTARTHA